MDNIVSTFGLTAGQTWLLMSLQKLIVEDQVNYAKSQDQKKSGDKSKWSADWNTITEEYLKDVTKTFSSLCDSVPMLRDAVLKSEKENKNNAWKYMILLECTLFEPFYPLGTSKEEIKFVKPLKCDKKVKQETLIHISDILGTEQKYIEIFRKGYKSAIKRLSNYWTKMILTGGIFAIVVALAVILLQPEIVALLAPEGLFGAAAANAVMAMLGGGAIAAGGLGIAGGWAVLVGGGFLIGGTVGTSAYMAIASSSSGFVLSQAARLEVVLKEIIMGMQNDTKLFQEILLNQQSQIYALKNELKKLEENEKENKEKIKNLKKSIEYLEKLTKLG